MIKSNVLQKLTLSPSLSDNTGCTILKAAMKLFSKKGLNGTTTREIAGLAKVNIAALHYHWGGKEDLMKAVYEQMISEVALLGARLMQAPEKKLNETFRDILGELHDFFTQNPDYARLLLYVDLEDPDFLKNVRESTVIPLIQQTSDYLKKLMKQGKIRKIDPGFSHFFLWILDAAFYFWIRTALYFSKTRINRSQNS
ncbi:MAG: TetR/AcrR family transcriptional regulator [Deltaproteobacteria bacterium]|nr:MAG: TetR/AcrR family transcriptional regulator [Deltaproteobacteria bacterium]